MHRTNGLSDERSRVGAMVSNLVVCSQLVRSRTGQPLLSETIRRRRLSFFGHLCRADANQDHSRALQACIRAPPKDWRRRTGRPRQTLLRTVEDDLRPHNFGLASARRRAWDRPTWRTLVEAATSSWHAPERERESSHNLFSYHLILQTVASAQVKFLVMHVVVLCTRHHYWFFCVCVYLLAL